MYFGLIQVSRIFPQASRVAFNFTAVVKKEKNILIKKKLTKQRRCKYGQIAIFLFYFLCHSFFMIFPILLSKETKEIIMPYTMQFLFQ